MEWQGLEFLGAATVMTLQELFGSPVHLATSFDGHEGAAVLIRQVHANTGENVLEDEAGRRLVDWADNGFWILALSQGWGSCDTYEEIVRGDLKIALELLKKTRNLSLAREMMLEDRELNVKIRIVRSMRMSLHAFLMKHVFLWLVAFPCWIILIGLGAEYLGHAGPRSCATGFERGLKSTVVVNFLQWTSLAEAVSDMGNFMDDCIALGSAISLVNEKQAALTGWNRSGERRKAHLASWQAEFERSSKPRESAQPYTVAIIISLQLYVMDESKDFSKGVIAWALLVCYWCCMLRDDL